MRKTAHLLLALCLLLSLASGLVTANSKYDVTEPVKITWWHGHEDHYKPYLDYAIGKFQEQNPLITVEAVAMGSFTDLHTQLVAAIASGEVPSLANAQAKFVAGYGGAGVTEVLDPYIEAYGFDIADFGEGPVASTSHDGKQIALPYLITVQVMYYNKTIAQEEGLVIPETFDELEAFLEKATIFNEDGTTARYGTVIAGFNYWYFATLFYNNGVSLVNEDGKTSGINSEMSVYMTSKMKEWIDKGYAYYSYGTAASNNLRQDFWSGRAFSVIHTSSLYDTYVEQSGDNFEVGVAWLPGGNDGVTKAGEFGGVTLIIPAVASQREKNAAWHFLMFMTSPEMNLYWADQTGYLPFRQSVTSTVAYEEYLERKPAMDALVSMSGWIMPRHEHPAYDTCGEEWRHALARIFNEGAPVQDTLDKLKSTIEEILEDN